MKKSTLLVVLILVVCSIIGLMFPSCKASTDVYPGMRSREEVRQLSSIAQQDTVKWNAFIECTNLKDNGGDAGCDSCFTAIYGYSLEFK